MPTIRATLTIKTTQRLSSAALELLTSILEENFDDFPYVETESCREQGFAEEVIEEVGDAFFSVDVGSVHYEEEKEEPAAP